ncbi:MAG: hypothetical protein IPL79_11250 [Myxococcales bacterium]|nr:hypothetical protein [Myxococcales bacterium]
MKPQRISAIAPVLGVVLYGCSGSTEPMPVAASYPVCELPTSCEPVAHATQGDRGDPREFQRYQLIGASSDGHKLAVLYSHFGPSSFVSFVNLIIYEADWDGFVFQRNLTGNPAGGPGSEEELTALEAQVLADSAAALTDAGIEIDLHVPHAISWCQSSDAVFTDHCLLPELTWSVAPSTCSGGAADPAQFWSLCSQGGDSAQICADETADVHWDCQEGALSLVDIYWYGDAMWVIAKRATEPLPNLQFSILSVGGTVVPVERN